VKERPILFSSPMVKAILAGRKTQTRRVLSPQPTSDDIDNAGDCETVIDMATGRDIRCPYGAEGDRLWVRETWTHDAESLEACRLAFDCCSVPGYGPYYLATEVSPDTLKWKPSIFMPRWASRITLEVTDVRVQRLQEISDSDSEAEGVRPIDAAIVFNDRGGHDRKLSGTARGAFACLWDSINGKRAAWASNPWVWAITFRRSA
jgi:hypothetical protein